MSVACCRREDATRVPGKASEGCAHAKFHTNVVISRMGCLLCVFSCFSLNSHHQPTTFRLFHISETRGLCKAILSVCMAASCLFLMTIIIICEVADSWDHLSLLSWTSGPHSHTTAKAQPWLCKTFCNGELPIKALHCLTFTQNKISSGTRLLHV